MKSRIITNEFIGKLKLYLYEDDRCENTIEKYLRDIRMFWQCVGNRELEKSDVLDYKRKLCESYAPKSVNSMLSSITAFFLFMGWHELKVKTLKIQRRIFTNKDKELTKAEYERLLTAAKDRKNERL